MSRKKTTNRCDGCGKFKPWNQLHSYGADDGDTPVTGLECDDCMPEKNYCDYHERKHSSEGCPICNQERERERILKT